MLSATGSNVCLLHNDIASARREMARVSSELQRLADTRLALRSDPTRGEQELANLPTTLQ